MINQELAVWCHWNPSWNNHRDNRLLHSKQAKGQRAEHKSVPDTYQKESEWFDYKSHMQTMYVKPMALLSRMGDETPVQSTKDAKRNALIIKRITWRSSWCKENNKYNFFDKLQQGRCLGRVLNAKEKSSVLVKQANVPWNAKRKEAHYCSPMQPSEATSLERPFVSTCLFTPCRVVDIGMESCMSLKKRTRSTCIPVAACSQSEVSGISQSSFPCRQCLICLVYAAQYKHEESFVVDWMDCWLSRWNSCAMQDFMAEYGD